MPSPNPTTRREYKGAAAATTLQNSMTNSDTSFVLVAANNWPTGSVGKFIVTINRGQADEEKILCDTQASRSVACQLSNRGFDGTTAQAHAAGATVECTISAFDADEWNQHTNATSGVHGVVGAVVGTTDAQTLTNKTLTSPTVNTPTITGGTFTSTHAATAHTPTLNNVTIGNGSTSAVYQQVGPIYVYTFTLTYGSTTAFSAGQFFLSGLPNSVATTGATAAAETAGGIWTLDIAAGWQGTSLFTGLTSSTRTWAAGDTLTITAIGFAA